MIVKGRGVHGSETAHHKQVQLLQARRNGDVEGTNQEV